MNGCDIMLGKSQPEAKTQAKALEDIKKALDALENGTVEVVKRQGNIHLVNVKESTQYQAK